MSIWYDITEARAGSRLPQPVLDAGKPLPGLEAYTGADILISTLSEPKMAEVTDKKPSQLALRKHCASGVLIQRKTGRDLPNSLRGGHLTQDVLYRMLQYTPIPILLFIGDLKRDKNGYAVVDGFRTDYSYMQVQGAVWAWQLRGGLYVALINDNCMGEWLNWLLTNLPAWHEQKVIGAHKPIQPLVCDERYPWRRTLETLPGIGAEKSGRVAEYAGTLWESLSFLSNPDSILLKRLPNPAREGKLMDNPNYPEGIGQKTLMEIRDYMGLGPDECLAITSRQGVAVPVEDTPPWVEDEKPIAVALPLTSGSVMSSEGERIALPF